MNQSYLDVQNLARHFSHSQKGTARAAVNDVSFTVEEGEIFSLLGPSGCGKTTTLRMIAGFEAPDHGQINLSGRSILNLPTEKRDIGIVFQDYALFPHLNILDNIIFALWKNAKHTRKKTAMDLLEMAGLGECATAMPYTLSGGQQQRAALIRALANEPKLLLLDEPFSNLDANLRQSMRKDIRHMLEARGTTCILVTHDQEEALSFSDRIGLMKDGHIEQIGTPEKVYSRPDTTFAATFLGRTNILTGKANGNVAKTILGDIPISTSEQGEITISLRPEYLLLNAENQNQPSFTTQCIVTRYSFQGSKMTYHVRVGDHEFEIDSKSKLSLETGDTASLTCLGKAHVVKN